MNTATELLERISRQQYPEAYQQEHWQGSFAEYVEIVRERPKVTRTAYQRLYDMIMSCGTYPVEGSKDGLIRYTFFDDPENAGRDAILG